MVVALSNGLSTTEARPFQDAEDPQRAGCQQPMPVMVTYRMRTSRCLRITTISKCRFCVSWTKATSFWVRADRRMPSPGTNPPGDSARARTAQPNALHVLAAIGDVRFQRREFAAGREVLMTAMRCAHGEPVGNPFLRLRLGQCLFELGETEEAANWLAGAFLSEGTKLFAEDDPKYLAFIKSQLQPPPDGWSEGW
ncbi:MAG: hypothetical protein U0790_18345 [Isosphaeraceae bacterium]